MGKVYYIDGKIGDNQIRTFLLSTTGQFDTTSLNERYPTWEGAIDAIKTWFIDRGFSIPIRELMFPYLNSIGSIDPLGNPFQLLYEADLKSGDNVEELGVHVGDLYINKLKTKYSLGSSWDLSNFPYLDYTIDVRASPKRFAISYLTVGIGDCVVDNKVAMLGKKMRTINIILDYYPANSNWNCIVVVGSDEYTCTTSLLDGVDIDEYVEDSDPFVPGGNSEEGGGDGDFNNDSTPIDIPSLPSISTASTGFVTLFNPNLAELNELASYMWSGLFDIDGWKKIFANPMDAILGLSIVPVEIPSSGKKEVKVGNISTGISLSIADSQFVEIDCGEINVNEYWGAYLDYEPYTRAQIFLPYIGVRPISVDEIMGKTIHVVYHIDILTGACCCFVKCGSSVLYTYNGQCSMAIPVTSSDYTSILNGVISVGTAIGSAVATGGATAPSVVPAFASASINQMKPQIEKSGSISGSGGLLNMQTPYLILIRPNQALPSNQNSFIGYPSLITVQLAELIGYTEIQSIHLENIPATQEELAEIQSLLEGGVIF